MVQFVRVFMLALLCIMCGENALAAAPDGAAGGIRAWQGDINGTIPVQVWYAQQGDVLVGEIVYSNTKNKTPIRLIGAKSREHNVLVLDEMFSDGLVTGTLSGSITGGLFTGTWRAPQKARDTTGKGGPYTITEGKEYPLRLALVDAPEKTVAWKHNPEEVAGTYRYSYGKNNAFGTLALQPVGNGEVELEIHSSTSAPAFNMADVEKRKERIAGDRIVCELEDSCAFAIQLFKDFVVVDYIDNRNCVGYFGRGAGVAGRYVKQAR
jgi:hypothetical protein